MTEWQSRRWSWWPEEDASRGDGVVVFRTDISGQWRAMSVPTLTNLREWSLSPLTALPPAWLRFERDWRTHMMVWWRRWLNVISFMLPHY